MSELLRDKDGKPNLDNIKGIPPQIWRHLNDEERREIYALGGYQQGNTYGLVRDKNGKPKFDNIENIPPMLWEQLTLEERQDIQARGGYKQGDKQ